MGETFEVEKVSSRPGEPPSTPTGDEARLVSLFSGVGALDLGLSGQGFRLVAMCESWEPARRVLADRFPRTVVHEDVATFTPQGPYEVLAAGFPCTDLSHAGAKAGIFGRASGLVSHVFRIAKVTRPDWILLENVPNLLRLHGGAGIAYLTEQLEALGYWWAYRTIDARSTGVPQRRPRVLLMAGLHTDPAPHLLAGGRKHRADNHPHTTTATETAEVGAWGFYWTEGRNGLGLVPDAVPTLKGGSTLGLPSSPAIWLPNQPIGRRLVLPSVEDGEALQGLPRGWTEAAIAAGEPDLRWKMIGNAVPVGVGAWAGGRLMAAARRVAEELDGPADDVEHQTPIDRSRAWPPAARGNKQGAWASDAGAWVENNAPPRLADVINCDALTPLSHRAVTGFLSRLDESGLSVPAEFYRDVELHQAATRPPLAAASGSWASSPSARQRMKSQRQRDTKPEVALRRALHRLGLGYRLQYRPEASIRTRMDIVFPSARVAVDVRGCFWHGCPSHGTRPRANAERWAAKLRRNVERDEANVAALGRLGWEVIVVWEHDDHAELALHIAERVRARRQSRRRRREDGPTLSDPPPR